MSLRNREFASLVVVGTLVGFGFASVYIARQEIVNSASLSYGLFFLGLYLAAHVIARLTVPNADPYLLPMAGLLTGIGLTEIYRLDEDDAFRQGLWIVIGLAAFAATLFLLHTDFRRLESYKYLFGLGAIALLVLPAMPVLGETVNGARLWVNIGPVHFQPGELAKILLMVVLVITNDLGGGLLYFGIFLAMLYVATARVLFVGVGVALFVGGAAAVYS